MLDFLAISVADVASISERRTDRLLDPARNRGLNACLADDLGVDSGHMIAQYTQAAIVSELKRLAVPASTDSIPSSAMQEDHVSMDWFAARKLCRAIDGLGCVLAVELYADVGDEGDVDVTGPARGRPVFEQIYRLRTVQDAQVHRLAQAACEGAQDGTGEPLQGLVAQTGGTHLEGGAPPARTPAPPERR
ncbi:histidine ammonia-lyase [Streptomyces sp. AK010]|nr:histidine ammonia-lyase [Streptomyces sp. AK010]